jgi:hypothetical protein
MSSVGRSPEPATAGFAFGGAGDDLVRILSRLTQEVERFDSMIHNQRDLLRQHGAHPAAFDDRLIRLKSKRISAGATEIVTRARTALRELRGVEYAGDIALSEAESRQGISGPGH